MSLRRPFIFTCDLCGAEGITEYHGGVAGFSYFFSSLGVKHSCSDCSAIVVKYGLGKSEKTDAKRLNFSKLLLQALDL